jgi:microsomal dipeptidase-like Zn-dependent dipeptidase
MEANGLALLKEMERLNIILDATHLCEDSFGRLLIISIAIYVQVIVVYGQ